jgi:hypothetical protein
LGDPHGSDRGINFDRQAGIQTTNGSTIPDHHSKKNTESKEARKQGRIGEVAKVAHDEQEPILNELTSTNSKLLG